MTISYFSKESSDLSAESLDKDIAELKRRLSRDPECVETWNLLISAFIEKGDSNKATETLENFVGMARNLGKVHKQEVAKAHRALTGLYTMEGDFQ